MDVEILTLDKPWYEGFPRNNGHALSCTRNVDLDNEPVAVVKHWDLHQETDLHLVPKGWSLRGHPPQSITVDNPSKTASFTYSLHLQKAHLVLEPTVLPPNTQHRIYWQQRIGGNLKWHIHD
ncbi:hypothetical protein PCANC_11279 [Puccinia coronata f. sp. avenae]|uniref:Uncharacterized protein n=1 Tax=Puccinia coronata f. sp. avenae TaxID=200324 RepID=A0A2N5T677_9BASI|nr:hypothetical protein PCANC_11279 [Puccinia coronata f. sp. avenae]